MARILRSAALRSAAVAVAAALAAPLAAAEPLRLIAPPAMEADGFLRHLLPRFSLKTGIRMETRLADGPEAAAALASGDADLAVAAAAALPGAAPALEAGGDVFAVAAADPPSEGARRFLDWLGSEVGARTVAAFPPYRPVAVEAVAAAPAPVKGDAAAGERAALRHCGRCHVVSDANRFAGIGSTPSFGALRALPRWRERFAAFWTLNPHPAFTQVEGMTEPFAPERPPPIAP
ncbi:MAG: hypothetical protein AAF322_13105, partial [Pseudomonadota bacterium]